eukprot:364828-Chlamydomonas_euryale.AAC.2
MQKIGGVAPTGAAPLLTRCPGVGCMRWDCGRPAKDSKQQGGDHQMCRMVAMQTGVDEGVDVCGGGSRQVALQLVGAAPVMADGA